MRTRKSFSAGSFSNVVGLPVERLTEELKSWDLAEA